MTNVVLVTVDSLRADHLARYGYERTTAPFVETLADRGISFDGYANANWTRASFPSIITSTYPLEHGGFEYLSDNRTTVAEALPNHDTAGFHSNLWLSREYNYDRGFDTFYDSKSDPSALARLRAWLKLNLDHDSLVYRTLQWLYDTTEEKAGLDVGATYKDAETITDVAIDWVSAQDGTDCFAWVHYMDVHHPYVPHPEFAAELGIDQTISEAEAIQLRRKMLDEPDSITDEEFQTLIDLYDVEIRYNDYHIERLYDAVESSWGLENTAFVFTSDHGEEFYDHGGFSHNPSMYDEVLHVPFIVEGADRVGLSELDGHAHVDVELLDTAPTVCALAGEKIADGHRGWSVFERVDRDASARVISETTQGDDYKLALRDGGWKFIWDRDIGIEELYDLSADSGETENLVELEREVAMARREELEEHITELRETNEQLPDVAMDSETERRLKDLGYLE